MGFLRLMDRVCVCKQRARSQLLDPFRRISWSQGFLAKRCRTDYDFRKNLRVQAGIVMRPKEARTGKRNFAAKGNETLLLRRPNLRVPDKVARLNPWHTSARQRIPNRGYSAGCLAQTDTDSQIRSATVCRLGSR